MAISPDQAADALNDIAQTEAKSRQLAGYTKGSRHFFLWGAIWLIGYGVTGLDPANAKIWPALVVLGAIATPFLGARTAHTAGINRKIGFSAICAAAFTAAVFAMLHPRGFNEISAFPPLVLAAAYSIVGIWALPRYLWIGFALFVLTLFGYFVLAPWFAFWMAAVGGGALLLSGLWLRKA